MRILIMILLCKYKSVVASEEFGPEFLPSEWESELWFNDSSKLQVQWSFWGGQLVYVHTWCVHTLSTFPQTQWTCR